MTNLNRISEGVRYGSGVHRSHLEESQYRKFQIVTSPTHNFSPPTNMDQSLYVFMMFWALGVAVVKIGILLFYWRIFIVRQFRRLVAVVGCIILTSSFAIFLSFMFQCRPIPRFWAETSAGSCIDQVSFYISAGSINIASDVLVLSLPMRQVWKLNATVYERTALTFLFCLGSL